MNKKTNRKYFWALWSARIWSIPVILYSLVLAIGYISNWIKYGKADPYTVEDYSFVENIPPFIILLAILALIFAWRFHKIGGIINVIFCLIAAPFILIQHSNISDFCNLTPLIIVVVVAIPGILYLIVSSKVKS